MVKAKIICTLGPASSNTAILRKMALVGMDVARLNFSHGSRQQHLLRVSSIRGVNRKYRRHIRILGDLEGNRIRIGRLKGSLPVEIKKRQIVWLTQEEILGEGSTIPFNYPGSLKDIKSGQYVYIDDGNIALLTLGRKKKL